VCVVLAQGGSDLGVVVSSVVSSVVPSVGWFGSGRVSPGVGVVLSGGERRASPRAPVVLGVCGAITIVGVGVLATPRAGGSDSNATAKLSRWGGEWTVK